jgi:acetyl-CoA hydrolase
MMNWETRFSKKVVDPATAIRQIHSGMRVYVGGGVGVPVALTQALVEQADRLRDVELVQVLTLGNAPYAVPELQGSFRVNALFIGGNVRQAVQAGRADFTPVFLSEIPSLFRSGHLPLDVALVSLSPPDEHGFCSFGVEVGTTKPAAESADLLIAEINPQMPRTLGDSFIHVSKIDYAIAVDYPIPEAVQGSGDAVSGEIGRRVAALIPDGATLQMGIGGIPDAVLTNLFDHRNLGIHSELFSDGVIPLIDAGVIDGSRKTFHPGKIVAGFMLGSQDLYAYVDDNPFFELHPTDYVNDPFNIAKNDKMVAINSALEIDLTGQVCADSIGTRFYSGVGGQIDFMRGAARAQGGLPLIALPATARHGTVSRIKSTLTVGAGVVTTRNDVHTVVTEFGVAHLYGKTIHQRVEALIAIAHPDFRDTLCQQARQLGYV